jgi:citrate synthase
VTDSTGDWDRWRGVVRSSRGGWKPGHGVALAGFSLFDDIVGKKSYFQLLILSVTGRMPERRLADWLEAIFSCLSWPDPRLWCNQVGALSGTLRGSPIASIAAGVLASDSKVYGPGVLPDTADSVRAIAEQRRQGVPIEAIVRSYLKGGQQRPVIPGYWRPLMKGVDERVVYMSRVAGDLGFEAGPHLQACLELSDYLYETYEEGINLAGYIMAFLLDSGMMPREIHRLLSMAVMAGVHACYSEAMDRPANSFLPLRCDDIDYQGVPERPVPDPD